MRWLLFLFVIGGCAGAVYDTWSMIGFLEFGESFGKTLLVSRNKAHHAIFEKTDSPKAVPLRLKQPVGIRERLSDERWKHEFYGRRNPDQ